MKKKKRRTRGEKSSRKNLGGPRKSNPPSQAALQRLFKTTVCCRALVAHQRIDLFVCRCRHGGPLPCLYFPFLTNLSRSSSSSWTTTSCSSISRSSSNGGSDSSLSMMDAACRRSQLPLKPHSQSALCHGRDSSGTE